MNAAHAFRIYRGARCEPRVLLWKGWHIELSSKLAPIRQQSIGIDHLDLRIEAAGVEVH